MKIYLDTCSLQRPLDSKIQVRVIIEAEAILGIIRAFEAGELQLISSETLMFEVRRNPKMMRREFALEVLSRASTYVSLTEQIENRAKEFHKLGIKPLDALHLASAEEAQADYFCTCDDKFLKKAKTVVNLKTKIVSPIELIEAIEAW